MSNPNTLIELAQFLEKAETFIRPKREETLLSVMGTGHYENPLSDLLAFFLKPQAELGLGLIFLRSLLSCIDADLQITEAVGISVQREAQTQDAKRPDFILQGSTWLLMIEHKVWSGQNNPFASYEDLAKTLSGGQKQVLYAVLSPTVAACVNTGCRCLTRSLPPLCAPLWTNISCTPPPQSGPCSPRNFCSTSTLTFSPPKHP
jgi:hypothetical protein